MESCQDMTFKRPHLWRSKIKKKKSGKDVILLLLGLSELAVIILVRKEIAQEMIGVVGRCYNQ